MSDEQFEGWLAALKRGEEPGLRPWERVNLLEHLCAQRDDEVDVASALMHAAIPVWRLDELLELASRSGNEGIALALLDSGATTAPLREAAAAGLAELCAALVQRGSRLNRRFASELAPVHLAAASSAPAAVWPLVQAGCDLTVLTPDGRRVWELAPSLADDLRASVGEHGPQWFRDAQLGDVDHYVFVTEGTMFGFNPNDVQTPIWTGDEDEGFGWPNTAEQALELLDDNRMLRFEVEWFLPLLEQIARGEEFGLDALGARVPKRRAPSWR